MHDKHKGMMKDNRKVSDSHQEGIERVKMRSGDLETGHHGKMGLAHKNGHSDAHQHKEHYNEHFMRHRGNKTPATA
jgi:hypothetical protein